MEILSQRGKDCGGRLGMQQSNRLFKVYEMKSLE